MSLCQLSHILTLLVLAYSLCYSALVLQPHLKSATKSPNLSISRFLFQKKELYKADKSREQEWRNETCSSEKRKCFITHNRSEHKWLNANCSYRNFNSISEINLSEPERFMILELVGNNICTLPAGHLSKFIHLENLILSQNCIQRLGEESFLGLSNLRLLDLSRNFLSMTKENFPNTTFVPLVKLNVLRINENPNDASKETNITLAYPDWALSVLKSLIYLKVDGLRDRVFGPGFQNMSSLKEVKLNGEDGFCDLGHLYNDTFRYLGQLRWLQMRNCRLSYDRIQPGVLQPFTSLLQLDVSNNIDLNLEGLIPLLSGNNNTLERLVAHSIAESFTRSRCVSNELAATLPRSLTYIGAGSNTIEIVSDRVFELMPPKLTKLDINNNRFEFGGYLQNISKLENLKVLTLNEWNAGLQLPTYFPIQTPPNCSKCVYGHVDRSKPFIFVLPPNLERLEMSVAALNFVVTKFQFHSNNSLKVLQLKGNNFPSLIGPVLGLSKLETLDLSNNNIRHISKTFFQHFPVLKSLVLLGNDCGGSFTLKNAAVALPKTLENLDMSNTPLLDIHLDLASTTNLKSLNLENCKMPSFTLDLSQAKRLRCLNLARNFIYSLSHDVMESLSNIPKLTIDFSNNTIGCYCGNMQFLNWLYSYPRLINRDNLQLSCDYQHSVAPIISFNLTVDTMRRECASNLVLLYICTSITSSFVFFIGLTIAYRFRWRLTYWCYRLYLKISKESRTKGRPLFVQDVFVTYCETDQDFVELSMNDALTALGCRVRLKGRDFKPGASEYLNIIESVQMCRRTLVVLSPEMLSDKWCKATVNLAGMEAQSSERSILIFLVLRPVTAKELGKDLLFQVQNSPVFCFPPKESWDNEQQMRVFWRHLVKTFS